ncbi:hypothetical protein ILYODFUR_024767 [Ilyodon furcidens]|uniref:Uncharacterized protein n=1 Tax=Ilyodon furcidens TaxID=33524 RepID=A0ABV0UIU0_9TELE
MSSSHNVTDREAKRVQCTVVIPSKLGHSLVTHLLGELSSSSMKEASCHSWYGGGPRNADKQAAGRSSLLAVVITTDRNLWVAPTVMIVYRLCVCHGLRQDRQRTHRRTCPKQNKVLRSASGYAIDAVAINVRHSKRFQGGELS